MVYIKRFDLLNVQVDGLVMGASLAIFVANPWLKEYEFALKQEITARTEIQLANDKNGSCHFAEGN